MLLQLHFLLKNKMTIINYLFIIKIRNIDSIEV
jgi:hypothetical protein